MTYQYLPIPNDFQQDEVPFKNQKEIEIMNSINIAAKIAMDAVAVQDFESIQSHSLITRTNEMPIPMSSNMHFGDSLRNEVTSANGSGIPPVLSSTTFNISNNHGAGFSLPNNDIQKHEQKMNTFPQADDLNVIISSHDNSHEQQSSVQVTKESDFIYTFKDNRYQCPREGCGKLYKNRNGLKYHIRKGACTGSMDVVGPDGRVVDGVLPTPSSSNPSSPQPLPYSVVDFANDPEAYARYKPFWCRLCSKRYKNVNGLKYHAKEHPSVSFDDLKGTSLGQ